MGKIGLRRLLLNTAAVDRMPVESAVQKRIRNLKSIWYNENDSDIGIEKLFRLFLAAFQFLCLGTYIKEIAGRFGIAAREIAVDFYVLFKFIYPIILLKYKLYDDFNGLFFYIMLWFMFETMFYIPTLIFASDFFAKPRSYRRSMLLLFFNYIEIVFDFGVIYASGDYLNKAFNHWFDPAYFSMITSATIGYGDYHPINFHGKLIASTESILFVVFLVLFINFFTNKVESKGYFGDKNKSE